MPWAIIELTLLYNFFSVLSISFNFEQRYMNFLIPVLPISANTPLIILSLVMLALKMALAWE